MGSRTRLLAAANTRPGPGGVLAGPVLRLNANLEAGAEVAYEDDAIGRLAETLGVGPVGALRVRGGARGTAGRRVRRWRCCRPGPRGRWGNARHRPAHTAASSSRRGARARQDGGRPQPRLLPEPARSTSAAKVAVSSSTSRASPPPFRRRWTHHRSTSHCRSWGWDARLLKVRAGDKSRRIARDEARELSGLLGGLPDFGGPARAARPRRGRARAPAGAAEIPPGGRRGASSFAFPRARREGRACRRSLQHSQAGAPRGCCLTSRHGSTRTGCLAGSRCRIPLPAITAGGAMLLPARTITGTYDYLEYGGDVNTRPD